MHASPGWPAPSTTSMQCSEFHEVPPSLAQGTHFRPSGQSCSQTSQAIGGGGRSSMNEWSSSPSSELVVLSSASSPPAVNDVPESELSVSSDPVSVWSPIDSQPVSSSTQRQGLRARRGALMGRFFVRLGASGRSPVPADDHQAARAARYERSEQPPGAPAPAVDTGGPGARPSATWDGPRGDQAAEGTRSRGDLRLRGLGKSQTEGDPSAPREGGSPGNRRSTPMDPPGLGNEGRGATERPASFPRVRCD